MEFTEAVLAVVDSGLERGACSTVFIQLRPYPVRPERTVQLGAAEQGALHKAGGEQRERDEAGPADTGLRQAQPVFEPALASGYPKPV